MSKNYTQLGLGQRYQIEAYLKAGMSQKLIAEQLDVHPSTISRELSRNIAKAGQTCGSYVALNAQRKTTLRHQQKPKHVIFSQPMKAWVLKKLVTDKWSPELVSTEGKKSGQCPLSTEWLYQWIWKCKKGNKLEDRPYKTLHRELKHGRRRRKRGKIKKDRGIIPNRISIEQRPVIVQQRKRLGDIEVDLMLGARHNGSILVMTDRATLDTQLIKLKTKNSDEVTKAIIKRLSRLDYKPKTLTFDNDKAFINHSVFRKILGVQTYFTRPYTSQDKGTVENRIGVLRRFFPKKTDLTFVTHLEVAQAEKKLNNRPVRKFNYQTPKQVLQRKIALIT